MLCSQGYIDKNASYLHNGNPTKDDGAGREAGKAVHGDPGGIANGVSGTAAPHGARHALYARLQRRGSRRRPVAPTPVLQQIRV